MKIKKILIVDDLEMVLDLLEKCISNKFENCKIYTENNPVNAIQQALKIIPDIIILDIVMPEKQGDSIANSIKNYPELANCKIIFFSGIINQEEAERHNIDNHNIIWVSKSSKLNILMNYIQERI